MNYDLLKFLQLFFVQLEQNKYVKKRNILMLGGILSMKRVAGMCGGEDPLFNLPHYPFQQFSVPQDPILPKFTLTFPNFTFKIMPNFGKFSDPKPKDQ